MPMPKAVCRAPLNNKWVQYEVRIILLGRGMATNITAHGHQTVAAVSCSRFAKSFARRDTCNAVSLPSGTRVLKQVQPRSVLIISTRTFSNGGSQIPEPLLMLTSTCPVKVQISQGLGPFLQIEPSKTGRTRAGLLGKTAQGGLVHCRLTF